MTQHPKNIDELRADFVARQNSLLPYDPTRAMIVADNSEWKDNSGMRWSQFVLAVFFLVLATILFVIPVLRDFADGSTVAWIVALVPLFFSWRLFLSTFRHSRRTEGRPGNDEKN
jgi:hypothetical protein